MRERVGLGASLEEEANDRGVAAPRGRVEGGLAIVVEGVDARPRVCREERPHAVRQAHDRRMHERSLAIAVARVDAHAMLKEDAHARDPALGCGDHQGRRPRLGGVARVGVDARAQGALQL